MKPASSFRWKKSRRSRGRNRVLFHTDAIQVVGKIPIRLADSTINSLSLSAHKLHGPKGVGRALRQETIGLQALA